VKPDISWRCCGFDDLTSREVYDILALRQSVFVVEQNCPYRDADALDQESVHLSGRDGSGKLIAYLRIVPPGLRFPEPSIGRVVTAPEIRGKGIGRALMQQGIRIAAQLYEGRAMVVSAQQHLEKFYGSLGFRTRGSPYTEDGIPHVTMVRPPA
jgi:ElaA protein